MNAYEVFASVYDELMDNIPYDDWCTYIIEVLRKYGVDEGLICELGCGTGEITERLADAGSTIHMRCLRWQMRKSWIQDMNPSYISCRT